jgi:hypothetical protein
MNIRLGKRILYIIAISSILGLLLTACAKNQGNQPDYVTVLSAEPTDNISAMYTIAAETIYAQITQTEQAKPTETPVPPTETPTPTLTMTNTVVPTNTTAYIYVPVYATSTPGTITATSSTSTTATTAATAGNYACSITTQGISDYTEFAPNEEFDATWTIKNTGSLTWDSSQIDYRYVSGTTTYKHNAAYDFSTSVASGGSITIVVDMIAPSSEASYETYWGVFNGGVNFCSLPLRIKVVD